MKFAGHKTRLFAASLILLSFLNAHANEGGGGGGEGGGEKAESKPKPKFETTDYKTMSARVQAGAQKLREAEEKIQHMIREKRETRDPKKQEEIGKEMIATYKEMRQTYRDYQTDLNRLKYEYPSRGDQTQHKYSRFRLKSLDEMEQGAGLDSDLERARSQMRKTYGEISKEEKKAFLPAKFKEEEPDEEEVMKRPTLKK